MRVLPEEERADLLRSLLRSRLEAESALQSLPFVIETPSQKRHKKDLEAQLAELESAVRLFSRRKVLVQADA